MTAAGWSDEGQSGLLDGAGEGRPLGEKAVPGVHGVGAVGAGGVEQGGDVQVAVGGGRRTETRGPVGSQDVRGVGVGVGIHRHGFDAGDAAGADHPQRDLAAVGDQNPSHEWRIIAAASPADACRGTPADRPVPRPRPVGQRWSLP